jgi:hypothetical protein
MHVSLPLPHPLARLTQIIAALEKARAGGTPQASGDPRVLGPVVDSRDQAPVDYRSDLEFLSLSRCGPEPSRRSDDLDFASLSKIEGTGSDQRDSLGDLSLERSFPPRPGS